MTSQTAETQALFCEWWVGSHRVYIIVSLSLSDKTENSNKLQTHSIISLQLDSASYMSECWSVVQTVTSNFDLIQSDKVIWWTVRVTFISPDLISSTFCVAFECHFRYQLCRKCISISFNFSIYSVSISLLEICLLSNKSPFSLYRAEPAQ